MLIYQITSDGRQFLQQLDLVLHFIEFFEMHMKVGITVFITRFCKGHEKTVKELIRYGANVNIKNNAGQTLLELAEKSGIS